MARTLAFVTALGAVFAVSAAAATGLTATIKGKDVVITNHGTSVLQGYFINSTDKPKITAVSDKTCKMGTSPWSAAGKKHVDYWANCTGTVKVGGSVDVKLTTSDGPGTIYVWAKTGKVQSKIATGTGG